jgi:hypothetical protein
MPKKGRDFTGERQIHQVSGAEIEGIPSPEMKRE